MANSKYPNLQAINSLRAVFAYRDTDMPQIVIHFDPDDSHAYCGSGYGLSADDLESYAALMQEAAKMLREVEENGKPLPPGFIKGGLA